MDMPVKSGIIMELVCLIGKYFFIEMEYIMRYLMRRKMIYSMRRGGYYIYEITNSAAYVHKEPEYAMFDYNGQVIMKGKADECPFSLDQNDWVATYGFLFREKMEYTM